MTTDSPDKDQGKLEPWQIAVQIIVAATILAIAVFAAVRIVKSRKAPQRKKPEKMKVLVELKQAKPATHQVNVQAMGTVMASRKLDLQPQVSGRVVSVHPDLEKGKLVKAGETLIEIEKKDYELAVAQAEIQLEQAKAELALEQGRQAVAKREWELLNKDKDARPNELALRVPQLKKARAAVKAAEVALENAKLNLSRTSIMIPFTAIIENENIDIGAQVNPQTRIASLLGVDEFWVEITLPVNQLSWISIPRNGKSEGSKATIFLGSSMEASATGHVIRLLTDLEPGGRLARILVAIDDPLKQKSDDTPLLIGSYVRVVIEGRTIENAFALPRQALHEKSTVWIANGGNKLEVRDVEVAWKAEDLIYVTEGLKTDDRVIVSDLATPIPGMPVYTAEMLKDEEAKRMEQLQPEEIEEDK